MKRPQDCISIDEIRSEIDAIDRQIIACLGHRLQYVQEIVRFKKNEEDILARKRYEEVLKVRRSWAAESHLDENVVEEIYKMLMHYFIEVQKKTLNH